MLRIKKQSENYKYVFFFFWSLIFVIMYLWGEIFLPEKYFRDSDLIMEMANGNVSTKSQGGSYYYTKLIFETIGGQLTNLLVFFTGVMYIGVMATLVKRWNDLIYASLLMLPHLLLGMSRPQKEVLVSLLVLLCFFAFHKLRKHSHFIIMIVALYFFYGIVRSYYFIIILMLLFFLLLNQLKFVYQGGMILFIILSLFVLPEHVFFQLQGSRDVFNSLRPMGGAGHETIYFNPFPPDSAFNFLVNYISSFLYFNFPIFSAVNVNTIFLQLYIVVIFYALINLRKIQQAKNRIFGLLFLSHLSVLLLFEPDLGSYMRHLSSVSIYVMMYFSWMSHECDN